MVTPRIMHLVNGETTVGAITSIKKIVNQLHRNDADVQILSYNGNLDTTGLDKDIPVASSDLKFNKGLNSFLTGRVSKLKACILLVYHLVGDVIKLNRIIKDRKVTIIHTHYMYDNLIACFALKSTKKVIHIRSIVNDTAFGGLGFRLYRFILAKRADLIIGISDTVLQPFNFPSHINKAVLYNGLENYVKKKDSEIFYSRLKPQDRDAILVGCVSRFSPEKGISFFIDIVKSFQEYNNKKVRFVIVAPENNADETQYKEFLLEKVKRNRLEDCVRFIGNFPNSTFFMPFFTVLVHPTPKREGFGNVVLEAHSNGVPVISTNCGGPLEVIEDGTSGFIVQKLNPVEFATKIRLIIEDQILLQKMRAECVRIASSEKFKIEKTGETLIRLYNDI